MPVCLHVSMHALSEFTLASMAVTLTRFLDGSIQVPSSVAVKSGKQPSSSTAPSADIATGWYALLSPLYGNKSRVCAGQARHAVLPSSRFADPK